MNTAKQYADLLKFIITDIESIRKAAENILSSSDNRNFLDDIRDSTDLSLSSLHEVVVKEIDDLKNIMQLIKDGLYVQDVELSVGKGNWRYIADTDTPIKAIAALRSHIGNISVTESMNVIDGYKAGIFK